MAKEWNGNNLNLDLSLPALFKIVVAVHCITKSKNSPVTKLDVFFLVLSFPTSVLCVNKEEGIFQILCVAKEYDYNFHK